MKYIGDEVPSTPNDTDCLQNAHKAQETHPPLALQTIDQALAQHQVLPHLKQLPRQAALPNTRQRL